MKKILAIFLVAASLLTVSCDKVKEIKLSGTKWQASMQIMEFSGTYTMTFATDSTGLMNAVLVGGGEDEEFSDPFTYTFDNVSAGTITISGEEPQIFTYNPDEKTITILFKPEEAEEMGIDRLVFHQI